MEKNNRKLLWKRTVVVGITNDLLSTTRQSFNNKVKVVLDLSKYVTKKN